MENKHSNLHFYLAALINYMLVGVSWAIVFDWVSRSITLAIALGGFWFMRRMHRQDMRNKRIDEELKRTQLENAQQEQYQLLAKNKLLNTVNSQIQSESK